VTRKYVHDTRPACNPKKEWVNDSIDKLTTRGAFEAGVNGGFFITASGKVIGDVGEGSQGTWLNSEAGHGNPPKPRWAFGWGAGEVTAQNPHVKQSVDFSVPAEVESRSGYGISAIGCLHHYDAATQSWEWLQPSDQGDWPSPSSNEYRTVIGWARAAIPTCDYYLFFQLIGTSWTWNETVAFCRDQLPDLMAQKVTQGKYGLSVQMREVMMLDGGGSTQFYYSVTGRPPDIWKYHPDPDRRRPVPNYIRGSAW
jgi:hypothetical protein